VLASSRTVYGVRWVGVLWKVFSVACAGDLLKLKQIAQARRSEPADGEDIRFLKARRPLRN
jgi:hypothetical protein